MQPFSAVKELLFMTTLIVTLGLGAWEMAYGADQVLRPDTTDGQWSVDASSLRVSGFVGDIEVVTTDADQIVISTQGHASATDAITVFASDAGVVTVKGKSVSTGTGISVTSNSNSIVVVNGVRVSATRDDLTVQAGSTAASSRLYVQLPYGTPLSIVDHHYEANVGDLGAPIEISTTGEASIGDVTSAVLTVSGNGEVVVARVTGVASVDASGNAQVVIDAGKTPSIGIDARGNTEVVVRASATDAVVVAAGNALVELSSVKYAPTLRILGNADVEVGE